MDYSAAGSISEKFAGPMCPDMPWQKLHTTKKFNIFLKKKTSAILFRILKTSVLKFDAWSGFLTADTNNQIMKEHLHH